MTLSIRDPDTDRLARDLAFRTGKPITKVIHEALQDYAMRAPVQPRDAKLAAIEALLAEFDAIPDSDPRSSAELMDDLYDEDGLPI